MLHKGDIKGFIGANSGDVTGFDDSYFVDLEADVVAFLESTVLRRWITETAERVEVVDGPPNHSQTIAVRGFIRAITTVEERTSTDAEWTELDPDSSDGANEPAHRDRLRVIRRAVHHLDALGRFGNPATQHGRLQERHDVGLEVNEIGDIESGNVTGVRPYESLDVALVQHGRRLNLSGSRGPACRPWCRQRW
jgi:hypothetical protein